MNKDLSRTTKSLMILASSIGNLFLSIIVNFVNRTVFIETLGKSYLGIDGLFSNLLTALSLAEFGIGNAVLYKLYEPIARRDYQRIAVLMKFYKSAYRLIGMVVLALGLILIPFLPKMIADYDRLIILNINASLIFCLFLLRSVSSYLFFAYRSAFMKANQKEYLLNVIGYFFTVGAAIVQIVCLYLFHNYYVYIMISILQVIGQNIVCAVYSDTLYPFLKEKTEETLPRKEVWSIFKDCSALFLYKMNGVVLKATDNLVISIYIGIEAVGIYSNYYIVYLALKSLLAKVYNSVAHGLGNLHTEKDRKHEYQIFEAILLLTAIMGGTAFIGVFICADDLILSWLGEEWVISFPFTFLMGLELYGLTFRIMLTKYRSSMGLFQQAKYRPLAGMIINLVLSVFLVRSWGICGVLVGTIVADWSTMMWFDPIIIYRYGFDNITSVKVYFLKYLEYFVSVCLIGAVDYLICKYFCAGMGWISVIVHALICGVSVPGILLLQNIQTNEGQYICRLLLKFYYAFRKR